jgi:hypothetical protein
MIELPTPALEYLKPLSEPERATHLLRALVPTGLLDDSSAFSAEVIAPAYFGVLAWRAGYTTGNLKSLKGFEAQERLGARMRGARSRSHSLEAWGLNVLQGLGCRGDALHAESALWWRRACGTAGAGQELGLDTWTTLRSREGMEQVIQATGLLIDWLRQVRAYAKETE